MNPKKAHQKTKVEHVNGTLRHVERYSIPKDQWEYLPMLPQGRYSHASIIVKDQLYVFCGRNEEQKCVNSIVKLDIRMLDRWHDILLSESELPIRCLLGVSQYNKDEVVIIGGYTAGNELQDAYIFNTKRDEVR